MINIIYGALPMAHKQKRRRFHAKMTSAKLYIYVEVGAMDLYIDEAHTALDIFGFAVFLKSKINRDLFSIKVKDLVKITIPTGLDNHVVNSSLEVTELPSLNWET